MPAEAYAALFQLKILHLHDLLGQIARLTLHGREPVCVRVVWTLREEAAADPHPI